ncbi:GNAT family N-acetyltransferase [Muricauda sp. JGD-17]|uniref:GNAT family N-acetyltransferase n=1 Tax=Flagellimonas ochracea TaxID=2696472 RepID=A0A964TEP7_9FLAO|nr:GNAT family protein [Allomuricauda ochracea]NAY92583.1 GNAT family N-acetyltransferase [Allomuricauda ochracea]
MAPWSTPVTLAGKLVELIPMNMSHKDDLLLAASDGKLWNLWYTSVPSAKTINQYIETALGQYESKSAIPFVIRNKNTGQIVGSTRFMNMDLKHKRLEIGYTWYAKSAQRTGINTECKYLLLQYAFESMGAIAVEFRTHFHNHPSRNAILRLGAKQDGILRNHKLDAQGNLRDTVVFSILDSEWKTVKAGLEFKMDRNS